MAQFERISSQQVRVLSSDSSFSPLVASGEKVEEDASGVGALEHEPNGGQEDGMSPLSKLCHEQCAGIRAAKVIVIPRTHRSSGMSLSPAN